MLVSLTMLVSWEVLNEINARVIRVSSTIDLSSSILVGIKNQAVVRVRTAAKKFGAPIAGD